MLNKRRFLAVVIMAALILTACSGAAPNSATENPAPNSEGGNNVTDQTSFAGTQQAPPFPTGLDWLNTDRPLTLEQLEGKVVLLDFWTYGCINCIHIIPDLKRLEAEYADELVVIGVHSAKFTNEGDTDNIRQIILRYEVEHPVINDRDFTVWNSWGARAWPTLVLIDPAGNIVGGHSGEGVYPLLQPVIASLVSEFDASGLLDRTPLDLKLENEGLPETVLSFPGKVLADPANGRLFISDSNHHRIVIADLETGDVLNVIGSGQRGFAEGDFSESSFSQPQGLALSDDGATLYVSDTENHALREVDLAAEEVRTLAGTGQQARNYPPRGGIAPEVDLNSPWDLALDGQNLYIAMAGSHQIWLMNLETGAINAYAGSGGESTKNGLLAEAELAQPSGLALDGMDRVYFADSESSSIRWAELGRPTAIVDVLVGSDENLFDFGDVDGVGTEARLQHPLGVDVFDGTLFVADTYNSKIKQVDLETGEIVTFQGGEHGWRDGTEALFYEPGGLDAAGGLLYVADTNNHAIRIIDLENRETSTLVLKGIEQFESSGEGGAYADNTITLDPMMMAAGEGTLQLDIQLPEGYKVNEEAPSSMQWSMEGEIVEIDTETAWDLTGTSLPVSMTAEFSEGEGLLRGDLTLLYCEAERESLCLIEQVRFEAPLTVGDEGQRQLDFTHTIELPEL